MVRYGMVWFNIPFHHSIPPFTGAQDQSDVKTGQVILTQPYPYTTAQFYCLLNADGL